jgi:two-component system heavy metal sensor histidine kinase CusS
MKSIGVRLAVWYMVASTATFAALFLVGRYFVERHAIQALELVNESEFEQIKARLGPIVATLSPDALRERVRESRLEELGLGYVEVRAKGEALFLSPGLYGHSIMPAVPGKKIYNVSIPGLDELRVGRFQDGILDIAVGTSKRHVRDVMVGYEHTFYGLLVVMIGISSVLGYGFSRMALHPVRLIQETANRIRSDNLSERIPVAAEKDEISDLSRLLNSVFDRLEYAFDQIRRFTAEASHELKTPLTLVRLQAEKLLVEGNLTPAQEQAVQMQINELGQLNRIIDELLFLSRADAQAIKLELKPQDPAAFLENFSQDAQVLADHHGRRFSYTHDGVGYVAFEQKWLRQVLLNLLANAINASPPDGRIVLGSEVFDTVWRVSVEDEGPGVPPEQRERIFERFVRIVRPGTEGKGSGLGLAICRSIIELHGGRIFAEAGVTGRGLRVVFEIPAVEAPPAKLAA